MIRYILAFAFAVAAAAAPSAIQFHAKSAFRAGGQTLPAGDYSVRTVNTGGDTSVLQIESANGSSVNVLAARVSNDDRDYPEASSVVFTQDGQTLRVTGFRFAGMSYAFRLQ